jgi:glycosyltransferase involved in cell wall biosynthesis
VAGEGRERQALSGTAQLGWLDPKDLELELARSRAVLLPSRWQEPFGMIGVEALAQATPVIVGRSGGTGDWTDTGCIVVERGDVDAMADALAELARDPDRAVSLGRSGREAVAARFARATIERRLQLLYEAVAAGARAPL